MKRTALLLILFLLIPLLPVKGDGVFVDDDWVTLSAEPHTLGSSGWVEFTLLSKQFSGDIDSVWGFQKGAKPTSPQIWRNYTHTLTRTVKTNKSSYIVFHNVSNYSPITLEEFLAQPSRIGNRWNSEFYEVTATVVDMMPVEDTFYVGLTSYSGNLKALNVSYLYTGNLREEYESTFPDWKPLNADWTVKQHLYAGMNTWYVLRGVHVQQGETYRLRAWVQLPWKNGERFEGKYCWGIKRSEDTLGEAIQTGRFYFIDPWWNATWGYCRRLTFNNSLSAVNLVNFPVMVHLNSTNFNFSVTQNDFDDIRFVDSNNVTVLDYEIESLNYSGQQAYLHVEVPQIDAGSVVDHIFLYYGNAGAASGEDVEGTWDGNFVMVQHLNEATNATAVDSTSNDNDGTPQPAQWPPEQQAGMVDGALFFDDNNTNVNCGDDASLDFAGDLTVSVYLNADKLTGEFPGFVSKREGGSVDWQFFYYGNIGGVHDNEVEFWYGANQVFELLNVDPALNRWHYITTTRNGNTWTLYVNGTSQGNEILGGAIGVGDDVRIGVLGGDALTHGFNGTIDEVRLSDDDRSADWLEATWLTLSNQFITFSAEQSNVTTTLQIHVTDSGLTGIENATCTLWQDGTDDFVESDLTNSTGYSPLWTPTTNQNYTLLVVAEEYLPYTLIFTFTSTTIIEVPLTAPEETLTIEFLVLAIIGVIFTLLGMLHPAPLIGIIGSIMAMITWYATAGWWLSMQTTIPGLAYLFFGFGTVSLILTLYGGVKLMAPRKEETILG